MTSRAFPAIIQAFFQQYLVAERGLSPNTILSYRDAFRLLLRYVSERIGRDPDRLTIEDFDAERVRGFLDWLETERTSTATTRNQRLAAIKTFFRYVASTCPEHLDRCRQIREISSKRTAHRSPVYLEHSEIRALVEGVDPNHRHALRDRALLCLMLNTGARVQEIANLDVSDLRLEATAQVRLMGKGRKERVCPLWGETVQALRRWLATRTIPATGAVPLFVNSRGDRLTRFGIAYILRRTAARSRLKASAGAPKRVTPHVIRHTTAMELLRSGVDMTVIAAWLGHADLRTTHGYVEIDLRMKRAAITATSASFLADSRARYPSPSVVAWLDRLGRPPDYAERTWRPSVAREPQTAGST